MNKPQFSSFSEFSDSIKGMTLNEALSAANRECAKVYSQIAEIWHVQKKKAIRANPQLVEYFDWLCSFCFALDQQTAGEFHLLEDGYKKREIQKLKESLSRNGSQD